jgi:hypothetical protein
LPTCHSGCSNTILVCSRWRKWSIVKDKYGRLR